MNMARFNLRARIATVFLALGLMVATWFPYGEAPQVAPRYNAPIIKVQ